MITVLEALAKIMRACARNMRALNLKADIAHFNQTIGKSSDNKMNKWQRLDMIEFNLIT